MGWGWSVGVCAFGFGVGGLGLVDRGWCYVGPRFRLCWPIVGAMLAHFGAMLAHLGAMLAHLGAMLAHLGAMLAHLEAYVGPAWGLCWPMLTHLKPQDPGKAEKMRRAQNTVKRGTFWRSRVVGGRGRGPSLLRRGENCRTAMPRPGGPWPDFELTLIVGSAGPLGPPFHRCVGVKVTEWGPASEIYSLGFLEHICWNRQFFGEQVSSRKLLRRVFLKNCCQF